MTAVVEVLRSITSVKVAQQPFKNTPLHSIGPPLKSNLTESTSIIIEMHFKYPK